MRVRAVSEFMIFSLLLATPVLNGLPGQRVRKRNHPPKIDSFSASKLVIDLCFFAPGGTCSSGTTVALRVQANDQDSDNLTYEYSVSAGTIAGCGETVNWDLSGVTTGQQTAAVEVTDQRGGKVSATTTIDIVECGTCDPPCNTVSVTCPTDVEEGGNAVFVATVGMVDPDQKLTYLWRHSNGQSLAGKEGPELRIKALGLPGDVITATVSVLGLDPACNREASCESRIVKRNP